MLLGGLWHGAAWNFVLWGGYHGILLALQHLAERAGKRAGIQLRPNALARAIILPLQIGSMFALTLFGWILFRCKSLDQIGWFVRNLSFDGVEAHAVVSLYLLLAVVFLSAIDWLLFRRNGDGGPERIHPIVALVGIPLFIMVMMIYGARVPTEFIYFQF